MAQASWSAPTRMVFLLHGEDSFRTRLRVGELVGSLRPTRRGTVVPSGFGRGRRLRRGFHLPEAPHLVRGHEKLAERANALDAAVFE